MKDITAKRDPIGNLHPRIILLEILERSDHDSRRILISNLDKIKMALPLVYPNRRGYIVTYDSYFVTVTKYES